MISFLIRLWRGPEGEGRDWQGEIRHVSSGRSARFGSLPQLYTQIERLLVKEGHKDNHMEGS